jgi:hypothetical protein
MVVDGQFKTQFANGNCAQTAARKLSAKFPMLRIEIYDAASKARTLMK